MFTAVNRSAASHSNVFVAVLVVAFVRFPFKSYINVLATLLFVTTS